jgi:uncharacterized protein (DUF924 family)
VLQFWLEDAGEGAWYRADPEFDARIRAAFSGDWGRAVAGQLGGWGDTARGALAFIVLTDQFPRNMFRDRALAFASDPLALAAAEAAVAAGHDLAIDPPARQFFYLPFMHAEDAAAQDRCVALFAERMPDPESVLHAKAHREVIRRHGRFPFRNAALGRESRAEERAFIDGGGYGAFVRQLRSEP